MDLKELIERLKYNGCEGCPHRQLCAGDDTAECAIRVEAAALTTLMEENARLRDELEQERECSKQTALNWAESSKALKAELEQVKRERDALLEYAKEQHECEMCENDTFCPHMAPTFEDCNLCNLECPCYLACEENDNWQWRGPMKEE